MKKAFLPTALVLLLVIAVYFGLIYKLHGEHKICDGMNFVEKIVPSASLTFDPVTNLIYLQGDFEIGIVSAFDDLLQKHPETSGVVLESRGGNVYQGRGIAQIITHNQLDTYSFDRCYSTCVIAYVAGTTRFLGPDAKLGFHTYHLASGLMQILVDVEKEQNKDLSFFREKIPDSAFVEKIFRTECPAIWFPSSAELLSAGVVHERLKKSKP